MADRTYLNVKYGTLTTEIKMEGVNRLGDLQDKIKAKFSNALAEHDAPQLQLIKEDGEQITDLDDVPDEYYKKSKIGGAYLEVRTELITMKPFILDSEATYGGIPSTFRSMRSETVDAFYRLLFPEKSHSLYFIHIRSPPMSGKTAMCSLLYNYIIQKNPNATVVRLLCNEMNENEKVAGYFARMINADLSYCMRRSKGPFVLLIDEGQVTYNDDRFWLGEVKNTIEGQYPNVRIVLFSSYGSFDPYRKHGRIGTPISIDEKQVFRLYRGIDKPGLQMLRSEFDEIITGNIAECVSDLIWDMSSRHIGVARAIILYLTDCFKNKSVDNVDTADLVSVLFSKGLIDHFSSPSVRGIPKISSFQTVIENENLSSETRYKMRRYLDLVAAGDIVTASDNSRSPGSNTAMKILIAHGFLHEDEHGVVQFASQMHHTTWLHTNRSDPLPDLLCNPLHEEFLLAALRRMKASTIAIFAAGNPNEIARERQIQMELYRATSSCLPRGYVITPEWLAQSKNGYVDMRISGPDIEWFWELLINGDQADDHQNRFFPGGQYHSSIKPGSRFVLIDFRQNKQVRKVKDGFIYVSFANNYTTANVLGLTNEDITIQLSAQ